MRECGLLIVTTHVRPAAVWIDGVDIRVSTTEQNAETQRQVLDEYCSRKGLSAAVYCDEGYSGDTVARPVFRRLRDDIRAGRVGHVLVFRLDRISRRTATGVSILHAWLDQGVRVTSVMESLDVDPANHAVVDIVVPLLFGLAANEQRVRRQRQQAGIDRARREGKYRGRRPGSTKVKPRRVQQLRAKGLSLVEIAATLGISKATVCRHLA